MEFKKIILLNSEKIAFIYILFLFIFIFSIFLEIYFFRFFFSDSNRGHTIITLHFYVLPLYHYDYELCVRISYSILYTQKGKYLNSLSLNIYKIEF